MPFVKRNESGDIVAVSQEAGPGFIEELPNSNKEIQAFGIQLRSNPESIETTDQDFIRVLEDVVQLLIEKGVIIFTELPQSAQDKISLRQRLRTKLSNQLHLIDDD